MLQQFSKQAVESGNAISARVRAHTGAYSKSNLHLGVMCCRNALPQSCAVGAPTYLLMEFSQHAFNVKLSLKLQHAMNILRLVMNIFLG